MSPAARSGLSDADLWSLHDDASLMPWKCRYVGETETEGKNSCDGVDVGFQTET